jgi:hypothetical protein
MSKFYSDKAPTPVFAVTFVSNRQGIIPGDNPTSTSVNTVSPEQAIQDINKLKKRIENLQATKRLQENSSGGAEAVEAVQKKIDELRAEIDKIQKDNNLLNTVNTDKKSSIKDSEYLIYSNLQIQKTDDPTDLSQQSNWYLREAEVELTRDWPIQKAKLIVTCKLLDNGSIPPLVEVEKGFVWTKNKDAFVELLPEGRFLSADDEVRIYAGYKNDQCISMNDLDKYPFNFTNLEVSGNIPADSADGLKLQQLQAEKKAIEDAINTLKQPLTDITTIPLAIVALASILLGGALLFPAAGGGTAVVAPATTATVTTTTTVIAPAVAPAPASIALKQASIAGTTIKGPVLQAVYNQAYNAAIKAGLGSTAAASVALLAQQSVNAETINSTQTRQVSEPFKAKLRDYLEGRESYKDNKELFRLLEFELASVNNSIQVIQRKAGVKDKTYFADPNKIAPIFWGFIDSVDFISNSNAGVQIIYNLRDRSRILADTKLVTLPFLGTDANNKNTFEGLKHKTVESVYRATNGGIYLDNSFESASSLAWRSGFDKGEVISLYEDADKKIIDTKSALANERLKYTAAIEDPARWVIANAFLSSGDLLNKTDYNNFDPLFHIWTLQGPLVSGSANNTMQIINKSPFEILSHLAMTEVMPIDIFTSHINGHFMFAPKILDTTGLYDEQRGNRLYYFFDCFDKLPEQRSLIKDIRVQTSTVGVYNRFTVLTADFSNPTNASLSGLTSIVDIASANTKNRKVPIKQHVIVDPKIKASEGNKEGAAQALALTTASTMARDHTMIIFKIIGDSSFYPGEAVRVFNTVLHSKGIFTFNATSTSSAVFLKSLYDEVQKLLNSAVKQQGTNNKVVDLSAVIDSMRKVAGAPSDDLNDALPMYKVRGITHSLKANGNDAGYTTKIVAIADIL